MRQGFKAENNNDENGAPAGGSVKGVGLTIEWQNGPLGRGEDRIDSNGAFVEDVIAAVVQRIEYYQKSKFRCTENVEALVALKMSLECLDRRTKAREEREVEGTHTV